MMMKLILEMYFIRIDINPAQVITEGDKIVGLVIAVENPINRVCHCSK